MSTTLQLIDHNCYLEQIDKLRKKILFKHSPYKHQQQGVDFLSFIFDQQKLSRLLARLVKQEQYTFSSPQTRQIVKNNKVRVVYEYPLTDKIVQGALYQWVTSVQPQYMSHNVYSYMKGRDSVQAVYAFAKYLRAIYKQKKISAQDVYVLRGDISSYTDYIPVHGKSELWVRLREMLDLQEPNTSSYIWSLLETSLRPVLHTAEGYAYQNTIGIPTGSPFTALSYNIYLKPLDDKLRNISGGFYARYGDDFIFAHTDKDIVKKVSEISIAMAAELALILNPKKMQWFYLTMAAKPCMTDELFKGSAEVGFLGFRTNAKGDITLGKMALRSFLRNIDMRMKNSLNLLHNVDLERKGKALCAAINIMLTKNCDLHEARILRMLRCVEDNNSLEQLDYQIALRVASFCTGIKGVKAFRIIPYKKIRNEWQLQSLCQLKNISR